MDLQQSLDRLRSDISGARLTAFGDLGAGLIFRTSHDAQGKTKREHLDRLCETASESYRLVKCIEDLGLLSDKEAVQSVIAFSPCESTLFARSTQEPDEVICTVTDAGHSLDLALQKTTACAAEVSQVAE